MVQVIERFEGHGSFLIETKYDGERCQLHVLPPAAAADAAAGGGGRGRVRLFSRRLDEMSVRDDDDDDADDAAAAAAAADDDDADADDDGDAADDDDDDLMVVVMVVVMVLMVLVMVVMLPLKDSDGGCIDCGGGGADTYRLYPSCIAYRRLPASSDNLLHSASHHLMHSTCHIRCDSRSWMMPRCMRASATPPSS